MLVISGVVTLVIALALKATMGWRVPEDVEVAGIDQTEHAESAYDMNAVGGRMGVSGFGAADARRGHVRARTSKEPTS